MSKAQRLTLCTAGTLVLLAALFPPWRYDNFSRTHVAAFDRSAGYGFLFDPPQAYDREAPVHKDRMRIDSGLLLAEFGAILGLAGLFVLVISPGQRRSSPSEAPSAVGPDGETPQA